ncbi:MAG: thioredoxin family protein [Verrucomicrobia bacterium]|nr:thioredoxin family protein [Cytophagales bacterium]
MKFSILLLGSVFIAFVALSSQTPMLTGYKIGDKATDFSLKNVDGKKISLAENLAAKGFIVIFTCNHCPYAKSYEDRIIALHQKYAPQGYPVVAINPNELTVADDDFANMQKRAKSKHFPYPYLADSDQQTAKTYGATKTPHVFLLKKSGTDLIVSYIGGIDDDYAHADKVKQRYVEQAVDEVLGKQKVSLSETKTVGCAIKWKKD